MLPPTQRRPPRRRRSAAPRWSGPRRGRGPTRGRRGAARSRGGRRGGAAGPAPPRSPPGPLRPRAGPGGARDRARRSILVSHRFANAPGPRTYGFGCTTYAVSGPFFDFSDPEEAKSECLRGRIAGGLSLFYTPRAGSKIWYLRIPGRRGFAFSASSLQPQGSTFSPKFSPRPGEPLGFWWFFQPKVEKMNSFDVAQCILLTFLSSSALPSKIRV